jgi:hypothetical protein
VVAGGRSGACTLLGPEGPERHEPSGGGGLYPLDLVLFGFCLPGGGGYRPYFENYTVDASILDSSHVFGWGHNKICPPFSGVGRSGQSCTLWGV